MCDAQNQKNGRGTGGTCKGRMKELHEVGTAEALYTVKV